jgi:hypothetical protein
MKDMKKSSLYHEEGIMTGEMSVAGPSTMVRAGGLRPCDRETR